MKRILTLTLALAACGAPGETPQEPVGRVAIDIGGQNPDVTPDEPPHDVEFTRNGDVYIEPVTRETDELMNIVADNPDLFPEERPLPLIPEIIHGLLDAKLTALRTGKPMEVEKWHSAIYHGQAASGAPCYGQHYTGTGGDRQCYFPLYKAAEIFTSGNSAGVGAYKCSAASLISSQIPKSLSDVFSDAALSAMLDLEHQSAGLWVRTPSTIGSGSGIVYFPITLGCSPANPAGLGKTRVFHPSPSSCQAGLASSNGVDPTCAVQTTDAEITIFPDPLYRVLQSTCGFTASSLSTNTTTIASYANWVGVHEYLHAMGFGHFTSGVMFPVFSCSSKVGSINGIVGLETQPLLDALTVYSGGHENDDGVLHDTGLGALGPVQSTTEGVTTGTH